jgi:hypothetical protein
VVQVHGKFYWPNQTNAEARIPVEIKQVRARCCIAAAVTADHARAAAPAQQQQQQSHLHRNASARCLCVSKQILTRPQPPEVRDLKSWLKMYGEPSPDKIPTGFLTTFRASKKVGAGGESSVCGSD